MGFDDGSKSIQYYNAETRKVLTSRNFHFLSLSTDMPPASGENPDAPHEGESQGSTLPTSGNHGDSLKRKRGEEEEPQNQ